MNNPNKKIYADGDPRKRSWKKRKNAKPRDNRTERVTVRFTPLEYKRLQTKAQDFRTNMAQLLRDGAFQSSGINVRSCEMAVNELNKVGNNLNQLVRLAHMNSLQGLVTAEDIEIVLTQVEEGLDKILDTLFP